MAADPDSDCVIDNLFIKSFGSRPYNEKEDIIKSERPKPKLNITAATKNFVRHFHDKIYDDIKWLCGCTKMQKLFCWPCLLFSNEISVWNYIGFDDLNNLSKARKRHENSKWHIDSLVKLKQFGNQNRRDFNVGGQYKINIENYNKKVTANRYILSKLIDVICFSSKQELAFKGPRECIQSNNRGDFIELVHLLSTSDYQLKLHLETSTVFTSSNRIQSDVIKSLGNVLMQEIKKEIENTTFVSIIVHETTEINHRAQLSTVFRYVKENGSVEERFVGFINASEGRDANSLFAHIKSYLEEFQCTKKLVAQTYDGAAVKARQHKGVQAKMREISKHAIFVHSYTHRLNLIFSQSVGYIKECKIFFQTMIGFSSFFSKSSKRSHALDQEVKKCFPSATPIGWNHKSRIVNYVMEYKKELKIVLFSMVESPEKWDSETIIAARGLHHYLTDFDFHFLLLVFHQIFAQSDILFDILQKNNFDIEFCIIRISQFIDFLEQKRNDFDLIWDSLEEDQNFSEMEPRKRIRLTDTGSKKESYEHLFYEIMDTLIQNCIDRFSDIKALEFLSLLDINNFKDYEKRFPEASFNSLSKYYEEYFDLCKLRSELQYLYACPDYVGKSLTDIKNIIINDDLHKDVLKELYNLISLVFTVPFTSTSTERSFSTLKRIHTFASNAKSEDLPLAMLSIEKELLNCLRESTTSDFYDVVIKDFAEKNRRLELAYKK